MYNSEKQLRILFIGMPDLAIICLNELMKQGKNIIGIVPPHESDPSFHTMIQAAEIYGVPAICYSKSLKDKDFLEEIKALSPDIAITASYNTRIPEELLEIPPLGIINCHPSLLPDYRGANPYSHVILNNEPYTGITFHFMDENFDTGDIISQTKVPVLPKDTMGTLFNRLNEKSAVLYCQLLDKIEKNEPLQRIKQNNNGTYKTAPKIKPEQGHLNIDWKQDAQSIERFVRALNPFYGSCSLFRGIPMRIWKGSFSNNINVSNVEPGTIVKVTADMLLVATSSGVFMPEVVQSGTFFTSDIKYFIEMMAPRVGEKFGF